MRNKIIKGQFFQRPPAIAIPDAVLSNEEYLPDLTRLLLGRFYDVTEVRVGIKEKHQKSIPEPKPEDIEEWAKAKPINSLKAFNKTGGLFLSNIERGEQFLNFQHYEIPQNPKTQASVLETSFHLTGCRGNFLFKLFLFN